MPAQVERVERDDELGRRERKKLETRQALVEAAVELFHASGVDGTTIEQIADRADVSERTFYRYFATKEDVLFADALDRRQRFATALAGRPTNEPLLESLRIAARDLMEALVARPDHGLRRQRLIESSDELRGKHLRSTEEWAALVSEHIARRLALRADEPLPRLLGSCVTAAVRTAWVTWLENPSLDAGAEIDRCFDLLGHLSDVTTTPRKGRRR